VEQINLIFDCTGMVSHLFTLRKLDFLIT
jgi:hypothetical protein